MNVCLWNFPLTALFHLYSDSTHSVLCQYVCVSVNDEYFTDVLWDCDK